MTSQRKITIPSTKMNRVVYLTSQGLLKISGPDSKNFLQGQFTCNLENITPTRSSLCGFCNPKGRVISLFRIFILNNDYYLQMPKELISITLSALKKYAVFYKVTMTDVSNLFQIMGYVGALSDSFNDPKLTLILVEESRYLIIGTKNAIKEIEHEILIQSQLMTENDWKCLDITSNMPSIYPETSEKFLAHDLHLHLLNAIDFQKGCYTGQEIIARMQYLGKLKNHLYQILKKSVEPPIYGAEITLESGSTGHIVDFCQIDYNTYKMLVVATESTRKQ